MTIATINRYIQLFADAFTALQTHVPLPDIERLAMQVHSAMDSKKRFYHTSWHIFYVCEGMKPRQVLAALFHDIVYYGLDGGFPKQINHLLEPLAHNEYGVLTLKDIAEDDITLKMCAEIFGFKPGQVLPAFGGTNEFFSAVTAVRVLHPYLPLRDLLAIATGIEATVPFRPVDATVALLEERVRKQSLKILEKMPAVDLEQYVAEVIFDAVGLANRDVNEFSEPNARTFLSETWLLIEESNVPLWDVGIYTVMDYRNALLRMEKFLEGLKAEVVFRRYRNIPDEAEYARLTEAARSNIVFACEFLKAKLTAIAIIEALALATGGNCPVSMFLGDIGTIDETPDRIEHFLPPPKTAKDINPQLLEALEKGRTQKSCKDLTESPLTTFVYRSLGHAGLVKAEVESRQLFAGELEALEFLKGLNVDMVSAITGACAHIAISRSDLLLKLQDDLLTNNASS